MYALMIGGTTVVQMFIINCFFLSLGGLLTQAS